MPAVLRAVLSVAAFLAYSTILPAAAQSTVTNTVTVTNPTGTTCTAGGTCAVSASDTDTVVAQQLSLTKTHIGNFSPGSTGTYTLTVSNTGTTSTSGTITVVDTLPTGLTYVSGNGTGWTCGVSGQTVTCNTTSATVIANGAAGNPITLTVSVAANAGSSVTNTARASGGGDTTCLASGTTQARCNASDVTTINPSVQTVGSATAVEGNPLVHTVTLSAATTASTTYALNLVGVTATAGTDFNTSPLTFTNGVTYNSGTGLITVPSGVSTFTVSYPTIADNVSDNGETTTLTVGGVNGTGTISDPPTVSTVGDATAVEGSPLVHTVTLGSTTTASSSYAFSLVGVTATAGTDFNTSPLTFTGGVTYDSSTGRITVPSGVSTFTVSYPTTTDNVADDGETTRVTVGGVSGTGTIRDPAPTVSTVGSATAVEGNPLVHTVTLSAATTASTTYALNLVGVTATAGTDFNTSPLTFTNGVTYNSGTGLITVPSGVSTFTVSYPTIADNVSDNGETTTLTVGGVNGTGTINDPTAPTVSTVSDDTVTEGQNLVQTVTLSAATSNPTTYSYALVGGTATAGTDFSTSASFSNGVTLANGVLTVPAGVTSFTVTYATNADNQAEGSETTQLTVGGVTGTGTINDPTAPTVSTVSDDTVTEGQNLVQTVTLSAATSNPTTYSYALVGGTATAGTDFSTSASFSNGVTLANGVLTVPAGVTSFTVTYATNADNQAEGSETTQLTVGGVTGTGTINDPTAPTVQSVSNATATEGSALVHTVTLSGATSNPTTYPFTLADGTATAPADYTNSPTFSDGVTLAGGVLTVPAGVTTFTVSYPTMADNVADSGETTNLVIGGVSGIGTINDPVLPIDAVSDSFPSIDMAAGGTTTSVLGNDLINGQSATTTSVTLIPGTSPQSGISMNPDGTITVAAGTPAGTYAYPYTICQAGNAANCDSAVASITISPPIDAVNDSFPAVNGGGSTASVLANDTLNGQPATPANVTLTPGTAPAGLTMNPDGTITVAVGTPAGTYSYPYTICVTGSTSTCDTATATVVVAPPIVATNDSLPAITDSGTSTVSVLANDTLNGQPVTTATVTLTPGTSPQAGITMNPDGTVTVAAGTPEGTYSYPYTICEIANPTNCASAIATVTVTFTPIASVSDTPPTINGEQGGTTPSVLLNDTLGGQPVNPGNVILTPGLSPLPSSIVMNPDGTITISAGTPAGTYSYPYTICERADPTNCASSTATVVVASSYDIRVTKTVATSTAVVGDLVRYTLTVENVGDGAFLGGNVLDTPPAGFTYVEGSLSVVDGDNSATVSGQSPIRIEGVDVAAGKSATFIYLMRVGAGVRQGTQVNQAQAFTAGGTSVSNIATASVTVQSDALVDESLLFGTVFDDRDGDGWQDNAEITGLRVQGGFDPSVYVPNSTVMDAGKGWQPQADASAPLLHGIAVGGISARQSSADPASAHQVVIRQVLTSPRFTDDFVLTTKQGVTVHMDAAGQTRVEKSGDAAKGLNGAAPVVERHISQGEQGTIVDYVIRNEGVDERGIPGVRVASVEGMLLETDQFGRYHLEGVSSGDWARGRNFIFKVDPSTLPAGATFTTANPLVRRITTGMPTRFDFGVKLPVEELKGQARTVELELGQVLFAPGSAELKPQYLPAVDRMAAQVEAYRGGEVIIGATGEDEGLAFDRANAVKVALLQKLSPETARAVTISVRSDAQDPASMSAGLDGKGPLLGELLFDTDKATIKPQFNALLDRVAAYLDQQGGGVISVVGHADRRGPASYNVELGLRRAKAVYEAIAKRLSPEARAKVRVESSNDPTAPAGVAGQ
ncbi:OmpA family protein [Pseudoxanthomonas sp. GM95]|uniref:OmpA family protein n=1 Tax=Pseudoxanthomonas sp. GM95 TaxID=1881043 RepID=UPI0015878E54|nr:OmpA family protein [Pseudoxanthomonas sp. GM95]